MNQNRKKKKKSNLVNDKNVQHTEEGKRQRKEFGEITAKEMLMSSSMWLH